MSTLQSTLQTWLIEPRDGLAFRDGRPNGPGGGSRSMRFPMPQSLAGAVRSRAGTDDSGRFDASRIADLLQRCIHGPLLVRSGDQGWELLAPAPQDALWEATPEGPKTLHHLHPLAQGSLRGGSAPDGLQLVGLEKSPKGKPPKDVPAFWRWVHLMEWLQAPATLNPQAVADQGQPALVQEDRISVAIDPETMTYKHGALFGVSSLVFRSGKGRLEGVQELALAVRTDAELAPGLGYLGGKNKLASFGTVQAPLWPEECPSLEVLAAQPRLRVMLLTPGLFEKGWKPTWLLEPRHGLEPRLVAARVDRPETLSGWDYELKATKPTRRAVSAGAVYWLELPGTHDQRKAWIQELWMKPVSDDEQDRRDGFGLAVMGVEA